MVEAFKLLGLISLEGAKKVEQDLEKVEKQVKTTGQKFEDFGNRLKNAGDVMTRALSVPLAALGIGAMVTAGKISDATGIIQMELGGTAEEAEELGEVAKDVWRDGFNENLEEVSKNVVQVKRLLGDLTKDELRDTTKALEVMNKRGMGDTQQNLRAISGLMKNFGLTSEEAFDFVIKGYQEGLDYSGEFTDTVAEYGTYFKELGFTSEEFFLTLQSGAEEGAFQLDKVGDAMKEFAQRAKDDSKTTRQAFKDLNLDADEMGEAFNRGGETAQKAFETVVKELQNVEDHTLRNRISTDLFGTQYEDLGEQAFNAFINGNNGAIELEGTTDRLIEQQEELFGTKWQSFMNETKESLIPLGNTLLELAEVHLPPLIDKLTLLANKFQSLSPMMQNLILVSAGISAVLGPLLGFIGFFASGIARILPYLQRLWNLLKLLRFAFVGISWPIAMVTAGVTALYLALVWLWRNWDKVSQALQLAWGVLKIVAKQTWNDMVGGLVNAGKQMKTGLERIGKWFSDGWDYVIKTTKAGFLEISSSITKPIGKAWDKVSGWIEDFKRAFKGLKLKIPNISMPRMPSISLSTRSKTIMGKTITYPTGFNVKWNAQGGYVDGATLIGAGEAGGEGIVPLSGKHMVPIAKQIASFIQDFSGVNANQRIEVPLFLDGYEIARAISPRIDLQLGKITRRSSRMRGKNL